MPFDESSNKFLYSLADYHFCNDNDFHLGLVYLGMHYIIK